MRTTERQNRKLLLIVCIVIVMSYTFTSLFFKYFGGLSGYSSTLLDDNISVDIQRASGEMEHYDSNVFPIVNKGDTLTAHIQIPNDIDIKDPALCFHVYNSVLELYYEDELLYSYGEDIASKGREIGDIYVSSLFPTEAYGKSLTLVCHVQEADSFGRLHHFTILPSTKAAYAVILDYEAQFVLLLAVCVLMVLSIFCMIFAGFLHYNQLAYAISVANLCNVLAAYEMAYYGLFNILCAEPQVNANLEYLTFYFLPVLIGSFFVFGTEDKIYKKVVIVMTGFFAAIFAILTILNYTTSSFHYSNFVYGECIVISVAMMILFIITYFDIKKSERSLRISNIGSVFLLVGLFFEILKKTLGNFSFLPDALYKQTPMFWGMFFFAASIGVELLTELFNFYSERNRYDELEKLAYTDALTGLISRGRWEEFSQKVDGNTDKNFAIIFFDLNRLKHVNDNYGHESGDKYIKSFSSALENCLSHASVCCRYGGDEFLALYQGRNVRRLSDDKRELEKYILKMNEGGFLPFEISAAIGISYSSSTDPYSVADAVARADELMYENKAKMRMKRS